MRSLASETYQSGLYHIIVCFALHAPLQGAQVRCTSAASVAVTSPLKVFSIVHCNITPGHAFAGPDDAAFAALSAGVPALLKHLRPDNMPALAELFTAAVLQAAATGEALPDDSLSSLASQDGARFHQLNQRMQVCFQTAACTCLVLHLIAILQTLGFLRQADVAAQASWLLQGHNQACMMDKECASDAFCQSYPQWQLSSLDHGLGVGHCRPTVFTAICQLAARLQAACMPRQPGAMAGQVSS